MTAILDALADNIPYIQFHRREEMFARKEV